MDDLNACEQKSEDEEEKERRRRKGYGDEKREGKAKPMNVSKGSSIR